MVNKKIKYRYFKEAVFKTIGIASIGIALLMLFMLLLSIVIKGYSAFYTHYYKINIELNDNSNDYEDILKNSFKNAINKYNNKLNISDDEISNLISQYSINEIINMEKSNSLQNGQSFYILASSNVDMILKQYLSEDNLDENTLHILNTIKDTNLVVKKFNFIFFNHNDSRYPEIAGIKGAFLGSMYTIFLTLIFSVIIGVGAGIYLEEFTKKTFLNSMIELNINNLAAIPSIVFGLLGLIVFQQFFNIPRATPLLASCVLSLMALPTIIIATKIALSSVPSHIKEAAYGMGATKLQVIVDHMLPISSSSILTGIIIGISRVIGETAPLMMIGMIAFMDSAPTSFTHKTTMFPVQIFLWSTSPEAGYVEKASAAIILLLIVLIFINWFSIYLRKKLEVKL